MTDLLTNPPSATQQQDEEEQTFDPCSLRANYALYPLEHLLYCEDCHQIRCARCSIEEVICFFCPSCLFEVPGSMVKSDGNRCTRNCYNCPICASPLGVNSLEPPPQPAQHLAPPEATSNVPTGPFYLSCPYCQWTSLEIGIQFDKPSNITGQLTRLRNGGRVVPTLKERDRERDRRKEREGSTPSSNKPTSAQSPTDDILSSQDPSRSSRDPAPPSQPLEAEETFSNLAAFYKSQIAETSGAGAAGGFGALHDLNFSSPSSLTRIMNLYSSSGKKTQKQKPRNMREALDHNEGFRTLDTASCDAPTIERMRADGWSGTASAEQRAAQLPAQHPAAPDSGPATHFVDDLRPVPALLRSKRSRRCKICRHILAKPENKVHSTRYKIKLLALNYVPRLTLRALAAPAMPTTSAGLTAAFAGLSAKVAAGAGSAAGSYALPFDYDALPANTTTQLLLTVRNSLFDPVRVTLATPGTAPGTGSRITILCPQFDVGANTDVWDEALTGSSSARGRGAGGTAAQAEAGKIWERGRNWTSVIMEVVPSAVTDDERDTIEDADVLEIPVFVRVEYEAEGGGDDGRVVGVGGGGSKSGTNSAGVGGLESKEKRELAFWCVLGVGRIA